MIICELFREKRCNKLHVIINLCSNSPVSYHLFPCSAIWADSVTSFETKAGVQALTLSVLEAFTLALLECCCHQVNHLQFAGWQLTPQLPSRNHQTFDGGYLDHSASLKALKNSRWLKNSRKKPRKEPTRLAQNGEQIKGTSLYVLFKPFGIGVSNFIFVLCFEKVIPA